MENRRTIPQESKVLEPAPGTVSGGSVDLAKLRHFELASGSEVRIALYLYGEPSALFWTYETLGDRNRALDYLYRETGWKIPNSVKQPSTQW
jgi:hypothetical protein